MQQLPTIGHQMTKSQIKIAADNILYDFMCGNYIDKNPLLLAEMISKMEFFIKEIKANQKYVELVTNELKLHGHKFQSESGTNIESAEVGTKYDYEVCEDHIWNLCDKELKRWSESKKEREDFLKTIPLSGMTIVVEETGEVRTIYPPMKSSTSSFKVTIGK